MAIVEKLIEWENLKFVPYAERDYLKGVLFSANVSRRMADRMVLIHKERMKQSIVPNP